MRAVLLSLACVGVARAQPQPQPAWFSARDGDGQPFQLARLRGRVVAVTFASRHTRDEASRVNDALRARAPGEGDVELVAVVDLTTVPSFARGYARRKIAQLDHAGPIHYLVDEDGSLRDSLQVRPDQRVDILVLDRDGQVRGRYAGERDLDAALHLVEVLRCEESSL